MKPLCRQTGIRTIRAMLNCLAILGLLTGTTFGQSLAYKAAPVDNPMKGLVPYSSSAAENRFPHSLEFSYFALKDVLVGQSTTGELLFDWTTVDNFLDAAKSRGNQGIFRIHCEYPAKDPVPEIPQFLIDQGVKVTKLKSSENLNSQGKPESSALHPDYENAQLQAALKATIVKLGERYDGDPRVGAIELGMLGFWGEWHNFPNSDTNLSLDLQKIVLNTFDDAFSRTQLLVRYPRAGNERFAANNTLDIGYHDDSFTFSTLPTEPWNFLSLLADADATEKWKTNVIGGELYPELNASVFTNNRAGSEFKKTVDATHASFMRVEGVFGKNVSASRIKTAKSAVEAMGYDLHFTEAMVIHDGDKIKVKAKLKNSGVAPFYYNWPVTVGLLDSNGKTLQQWSVDWRVDGLLPDVQRTFTATISPKTAPPTGAKFAVRVPNPMEGGRPLRFSNATQQIGKKDWMILGSANKN